MKIAIIGQGYVGQSLAVGAASAGFDILGIDINSELIKELSIGQSFIPGISKNLLTSLIEKKKYTPTLKAELMSNCEIIVIAVPTPVDKNRNPELSLLKDACKSIQKYASTDALIISESTSYPGTLRNLIKPTVELGNSKRFKFAVAPERVDPGNFRWDLNSTTRVVSGLTDEATDKAIAFYSKFCENIYRASSPEVAEAAKLLENTFRQVNIALINEFSYVMSSLNISANEVVDAAATKPFGFMKFVPSIGVGGHCIPVDPEYFTNFAQSQGMSSPLTSAANRINSDRPNLVVDMIRKYLGVKISGLSVQLAGIAYKSDVPDIRESPALELIQELRRCGAKVSWHDPLVEVWQEESSTPIDPAVNLGLVVTPHSKIDFSPWITSNTLVLDLSVDNCNLGWPRIL